MTVARQLSLFGGGEPSIDLRFAGARRIELGRGAWVEHVRAWVRGHDTLFTRLEQGMRWHAQRRVMYERVVDVPRLFARVPEDGAHDPLLGVMGEVLGRRYGVVLDSILLALYRSGADSADESPDQSRLGSRRSLARSGDQVPSSVDGGRREWYRGRMMQPATHLAIDRRLCGEPVSLDEGAAVTRFVATPEMAADERGLVHGSFVFGLADYAAMLAVNHPNVVLGSADVRFTAPVRVGEEVTATATRTEQKGKKHVLSVQARVGDREVLTGTMTAFVLERHVLDAG